MTTSPTFEDLLVQAATLAHDVFHQSTAHIVQPQFYEFGNLRLEVRVFSAYNHPNGIGPNSSWDVVKINGVEYKNRFDARTAIMRKIAPILKQAAANEK